jgi:hypothetical protein
MVFVLSLILSGFFARRDALTLRARLRMTDKMSSRGATVLHTGDEGSRILLSFNV